MADQATAELPAPQRLNVLVVGDTGVGKSSLVNAVLGDTRARSGIGAPVTKHPEYFTTSDGKLGIWDFPGFEYGRMPSPMGLLARGLREISKAGPHKAAHVAWFCWDASSARVTRSHRALIRTLTKAGIPVLAVLTKVSTKDGHLKDDHLRFAQWIQDANVGAADPKVYPTASVLDDLFGSPVYGLAELLEASAALGWRQRG